MKRHRDTLTLTEPQYNLLSRLYAQDRMWLVKTARVSQSAIRNYLKGEKPDRSVYERLCVAFDSHTTVYTLPPVNGKQVDWSTRLDEIFQQGCGEHFDHFQVETATETLGQFVDHPALDCLPLEQMLENISVIMTVFRQNSFTSASHYLTCARRCQRRLKDTKFNTDKPAIQARVALIAWELAAAAIQRGHATEGNFRLIRVEAFLDRRQLWKHLPAGRERTLRRMHHWGLIVIGPHIQEVGKVTPQRGTWLDEREIGQFYDRIVTPERINTDMHRAAELLRLVDSPHKKDPLGQAITIVDSRLFPRLNTLNISRLVPPGQNGRSNEIVPLTPPALLGSAFQSLIIGGVHGFRETEYVSGAIEAAAAIYKASEGSTLLCHTNTEMKSALRAVLSQLPEIQAKEVRRLFNFVPDLPPAGAQRMLQIADQILLRLEQSHPVQVRGAAFIAPGRI